MLNQDIRAFAGEMGPIPSSEVLLEETDERVQEELRKGSTREHQALVSSIVTV